MKFTNRYNIAAPERPRWEKTPDGFLRCRARLLAERVMPYATAELGDALPPEFATAPVVLMAVKQDSMAAAESLRSLEGIPLVAGEHQWLTPALAKGFTVGAVAGTPRMDGPYLVSDLLVTDPDTIEQIENGQLPEISAAYSADTIFEPGTLEGQPYDAVQTALRYNHIAIIPAGHGRAGADVRILNTKKEEKVMFKVRLINTGKFIQVENEDDVKAIEAEGQASEEKTVNLEQTMNELEVKNGEMSALQGEVETLKGELSVYKEKLDELLSTEAVEHAAMDMMADADEGKEILENTAICNEEGAEDETKKAEVMNSLKGLHGQKLYVHVLNTLGVKTEGLSPEAIKGAFKAQHQITNAMKGKGKVAGTKLMNGMAPGADDLKQPEQKPARTPHQRLGLKEK